MIERILQVNGKRALLDKLSSRCHRSSMREKELRLALVCYGGISLAVYMHGVTKEVWRLAEASRDHHMGGESGTPWGRLLTHIQDHEQVNLRVLPDIISGASAGGINGIFLAQALATGQSLDPLTRLWLDYADVDRLIAPEARPETNLSKVWATPLAWYALKKSKKVVDATVAAGARDEVREKLTRFVRARWFEPPFGGPGFTSMVLNAFDTMAAQPRGERLLPPDQPLDLFVSVTDFRGSAAKLKLNSPAESYENEHRLMLSFRQSNSSRPFAETPELAFAARATASFPGAFPPFSVSELDGVLNARQKAWPGRSAFLSRALGSHSKPESAILIDGSVLANAPFKPAIEALKDRPAHREVDRRFVYIDPKPGIRAVRLGKTDAEVPGFFSTIIGALSELARIGRFQSIVEALRPSVDAAIEKLFGRTFFLDSPTAPRIDGWRRKAQLSAASEAGYAFAAYAQIKLAGIIAELTALAARQDETLQGEKLNQLRKAISAEIEARGAAEVWKAGGKGASDASITFFRAHDLGFRIRRLRFVIRTLSGLIDGGRLNERVVAPLKDVLFSLLSAYLDRQGIEFYQTFDLTNAATFIDDVAAQRSLSTLDAETDTGLANAFAACPKAERRVVLYAYLGFPYFDISTLPMLQGEGLDEFDPIKVDRISPEDAHAIRSGVTATLKGIEFNSFGAFFSRAYRENDYLWGRLHGAERLFDIVCSSIPSLQANQNGEYRRLKRDLLLAILAQEEGRLTRIPELFGTLRAELAAGPLADPSL
jgi:patatin-related protein